MSHFTVWVLVQADEEQARRSEYLKSEVERLVKPYDEGTEVPAYKEACYCVGNKARGAARDAAAKVESIDQIRDRFHKIPRVVELEKLGGEFDGPKRGVSKSAWGAARREVDAMWKAETAALHARETIAFEARPDKAKADPKCDECKGKGEISRTYNPKSKWDWWVVGGRWAGEITKSPVPDDENPFITGNQASADRVRGEREAIGTNSRRVALIPLAPVGDHDDEGKFVHLPYAIVTPDGEWHEKGEMGWFGCSSNEREDWPVEARRLLALYGECIAVAIDAHI